VQTYSSMRSLCSTERSKHALTDQCPKDGDFERARGIARTTAFVSTAGGEALPNSRIRFLMRSMPCVCQHCPLAGPAALGRADARRRG
jgi:hypothetical protein